MMRLKILARSFARPSLLTSFATLLASSLAFAQAAGPSIFAYEGVLTDANGAAVTGAVNFDVLLVDAAGSCVLYKESKPLTLGADGRFSLTVGNGTRATVNGGSGADALTLKQLLSNGAAINGAGNCAASVASGSGRYARIVANGVTMTPDVPIGSAPYSMVADTLQGLAPSSFIRAQGNVTQTSLDSLGASSAPLLALASGSSNLYVKSSASGAASVPGFSTQPAGLGVGTGQGTMWFDTATNQLKYWDGSGSAQTVGAAGAGVSSLTVSSDLLVNGAAGGTMTTPGTIGLASVMTPGTYAKVNVDAKGRVIASASLVETDIPALVTPGRVAPSAVASGTFTGQMYFANGFATSGTATASGFSSPNYALTNGSATMNLRVAAGSGGYNYVFPASNGAPGNTLTTDGAGNLSWTASAGGSVNAIFAGAGIVGGPITTSGTLSVDVGTTANKIVQLNGSGALPAVNGNSLFSLNVSNVSQGTLAVINGGTGLSIPPAAGALLAGNGTGGYTALGSCANGNTISWTTGIGFGCVAMPTSPWATNGPAVVTSSGTVGIGTTTPSAPLTVAATSSISSGTFVGAVLQTGYSQAGAAGSTDLLISRSESGVGSGAHKFLEGQVGGLSRFNVTNAGGAFFAGSVGIGTSAPLRTLSIVSSTAGGPAAMLQNTSTNGLSGVEFKDYSGVTQGVLGFGNSAYSPAQNVMVFGSSSGTTPIAFTVNSAERMRLPSSGFVGIGTTAPAYPLDVAGPVRAQHFVGAIAGSAPTIGGGTGAGSAPSVSVAGTDSAMSVSVTPGSGAVSNSNIASVTFGTPFSAPPLCVFSPANAAAATAVGIYISSGSGTNVALMSSTTALATGTQYAWNIHCIQ